MSAPLLLLACSEGGDGSTASSGSSSSSGDDDGSGGADGGDDSGSDEGADSGNDDAADEGSDDDDDGGSTFLAGIDMETIATCDPWAQDCPDGEKCVFYRPNGANSNRCVPVESNAKQPGDSCTPGADGMDDCDETSYCGNTGSDVCVAFCIGSASNPGCAAPEEICAIDNEGTLLSCTQKCDPVIQDCNTSNSICMEAYGVSGFSCVGSWSDPIQVGEPCVYINACAAGLGCYAGVTGCNGDCCTPFCELGDGSSCAALPGNDCLPFFPTPVLGYEHVGLCLSPA